MINENPLLLDDVLLWLFSIVNGNGAPD